MVQFEIFDNTVNPGFTMFHVSCILAYCQGSLVGSRIVVNDPQDHIVRHASYGEEPSRMFP